MVCSKCGAQMAANEQFCPVCGERPDMHQENSGVKPRRQYKTVLFVILSIWVGGCFFGINDLYAGFNKMGLARTVGPVVGLLLLILGGQSQIYALMGIGLGLLVISFFIGIWELFMLSSMAYRLANGQVVMIRPLDLKLDRKGVEQYLINTYGCGLKG
ncbi:MAG: zinc ribbon domain-containing protein [Ruminococcaceae bacterium]|nr:zinc ribbon domain-containing protein [Oscillospiraceae bacterium]